MLTLLFVVVSVSVLILIHEWGHFFSARALKMRVEEFGFGFPPRLWSRVRNGVRYSINMLPFGGFVKIFGEHGEGEKAEESFASRPPWQRFIVLFAGIGMNIVLAWLLFSVSAGIGTPRIADEASAEGIPVSIITVLPDSPAQQAGMRVGDHITQMHAEDFSLVIEQEQDVIDFVDAYRGEAVTLVVARGSETVEVVATPRANYPDGEGPLGIALARITTQKTPLLLAPIEGGRMLIQSLAMTVTGLGIIIGQLVTQGGADVAVSGPVGIFFLARDTQSLGVAYFLQFVGILSVNLAILNFLPIPALDGGRIFFLLIEKLRQRRISPTIENMAHTVGFLFLIVLMVLITYRDIARLL